MVSQFKENKFVLHNKHGVGRVALADKDGVLVEFDSGAEELFEIGPRKSPPIKKLGPDGFLLQFRNQPDEMRALAADNAPDMIKLLHKDLGNELEAKKIQKHLCGTAVDKDAWAAWWKDTLAALKEDPRFVVEKNSLVQYLGDMVEIAGDLLLKFKKARNIKEKQKVCREILKMEERGVPAEDAKEAAIIFFTGTAASTTNNIGARLEALLFLEDLDPVQHGMVKDDIYSRIHQQDVQDAAKSLEVITDNIIRTRLLDIYKEQLSGTFIEIATTLTKRYRKQQRDWVLDTLLDDENTDYIRQILDTTLTDVPTNEQPFVWFGKKMLEDPEKLIALGYDAPSVISRFFKLLTDVHITSAFSANPKDGPSVSREEDEIIKFLIKKKPVLKLVKKQPDDIVLLFARQYMDNKAIQDDDKDEMLHMLREQHPGLDFDTAIASIGIEEDGLMLSREAFDRFEAEYKSLIEIQLPEVSKAIGTAREWGDISENAEYHAAKEKQGLLMSRKRYLERVLETAQILDE